MISDEKRTWTNQVDSDTLTKAQGERIASLDLGQVVISVSGVLDLSKSIISNS